jgi:hypothetical protein
MSGTVDRLSRAAEFAAGKRVLDIGGRGMPPCAASEVRNPWVLAPWSARDPSDSPFARSYRRIREVAREYRVLDVWDEKTVDYVVDLNRPESMAALRGIIESYRPETILCMETLEHVNFHFEAMNEMARAVAGWGATVFITLPNNGNWVLNALGWNHDHCIGFFRDLAWRFVTRSDLGRHRVSMIPCFQKYLWYWPIAYVVALMQPFSWGFVVEPKSTRNTAPTEAEGEPCRSS